MCKAFLETAMVIPIVQHNSYKLQNYALAWVLGHRFSLISWNQWICYPQNVTCPVILPSPLTTCCQILHQNNPHHDCVSHTVVSLVVCVVLGCVTVPISENLWKRSNVGQWQNQALLSVHTSSVFYMKDSISNAD
jgi:hypothetical protein